MSGIVCSSVCFSALMGGGGLELGIVQGNVALKKRKKTLCFLLSHRSCMPPFACILQT